MERKCTWVRVHVDSRPMYMYLLLLYSTIPVYLLRYNGNEIKLGLSFCCTFETKLVLLISIIRLKMNYGYPWEEKNMTNCGIQSYKTEKNKGPWPKHGYRPKWHLYRSEKQRGTKWYQNKEIGKQDRTLFQLDIKIYPKTQTCPEYQANIGIL